MQDRTIFIFIAALLSASMAFAANSGITYQGRIVKPDGSPLSGQYTQFRLQIRTPDAASCLMYEEAQSIDLRNSNGRFSLTINDGSGSRIDTTGLTLDRIFANRGTMVFNPSTCTVGGGSYNPNVADGRSLVVLFKDESMTTWEPIPSQKINFVPFAFESKQVQGFTADSLLRVVDGSGDPITGLAPLSNAQYSALLALINGTSPNYAKAGQLGGVSLPTMNSGEVLGWNGANWVSTATSAVPATDSITEGMLQAHSVGTSQIKNDISISTSGTISSAATLTKDFQLYAAAPATSYIDMKAPALASSYSLIWPLDAGSAGEVLTTNGSGVLSWSSPTVSSQWVTGAANSISYSAGNVGIGTTSPSNFGANYKTLQATGVNGGVFRSSGTGATPGSADFYWDGTNGTAGAMIVRTATAAPMSFQTNSAERMRITDTGNVGIGTTNPVSALEVNGVVTATAGTSSTPGFALSGTSGTGISGSSSMMHLMVGGTPRLQLGTSSMWGATNYGPLITYGAGAVTAAAPAYGFLNEAGSGMFRPALNSVGFSTSSTERVRIDASGNVGIGTTSPAEKLEVSGAVKATNYITASDRRLKSFIRMVEGWNAISRLRGARYVLNSSRTEELGLIAQEVEEVFPEAVVTNPDTGMKGVKYQSLIAPMIESIKDIHRSCEDKTANLDRRVSSLEKENTSLRKSVEELRAQIAQIQAQIVVGKER